MYRAYANGIRQMKHKRLNRTVFNTLILHAALS